jgi:hypothetical protein
VSYAPPAGSVLPFNFTGSAYTAPSGSAVDGDFADLASQAFVAPEGIAGAFGAPTAENESPTVFAAGFDAGAFGVPTNALAGRQVITQWVAPTAFGATTVSSNRVLTLTGIAAGSAGTPFSVVNGYYAPPVGSALPFNFSGGYAPPLGSALPFDFTNTYSFLQIVPSGFTGAMGAPTVYNLDQYAFPPGLVATEYGTPSVVNTLQVVYISGPGPETFGTASVINAQLFATPAGFDASSFGDARVELFERTIIAATTAPGEPGTPTVWYLNRTVEPGETFFDPPWSQFGTALVWDGVEEVYPTGIPAGDVGAHTAQRNERFVVPDPITGAMGQPDVQLRTRFVVARDTPPLTEWGFGLVYNSDQHVQQLFDEAANDLDHAIGEPDLVENVNRVVGTFGFVMSKLPNGAEVFNNARLVVPPGEEQTTFGTALVAYAIRTIITQGDDESYFVPWHAVHNSTSIVEPSGIPRDHPGIPRVWDNTQHVDPAGGNDLTEFGTAFAAYRIRTVDVDHWGIDYGFFSPDVYVGLYRQHVVAEGFEGGVGTPTLEHHRNIVALLAQVFIEFGEASVRNNTPQLFVGSMDYPHPPRPTVDFRVKYVEPEGFDATLWYRPYVGPRTRTLVVNGPDTLRIPTHRVRFDAPEIPPQQVVLVAQYALDLQHGLGVPALMRRGAIGVGWDSLEFGTPTVHANSIYPTSIHPDFHNMFGTAVLNPTQFVAPEWPDVIIPVFPEPRISPTTIWISEPPPPRLRKEFSIVDEFISSTYPSWGVPDVSHNTRFVLPYHDTFSTAAGEEFGDPFVALRVRRVLPEGIAPRRFGTPQLPSGQLVTPFWGRDTEDWIEGGDFDTAGYGEPVVSRPFVFDPNVYPAGETETEFGEARVELFNRVISPASWYSNIFTGDNWVHPPIVLYPVGTDMTQFGTTWASYKHRTIFPEGYLTSKFEFSDWSAGHMTVRNNWYLALAGIAPPAIPSPVVTLPDLGAVVTLGDTLQMGRPRIGECAC